MAVRRCGAGKRPRSKGDRRRALQAPASLLATNWELLPSSLRQVTEFRNINFWNTSSFDKHVVPFRAVALRSHQFIIIPRCCGSRPRQRKRICDHRALVLKGLGHSRCRREPALRLLTILGLYKRLLRAT